MALLFPDNRFARQKRNLEAKIEREHMLLTTLPELSQQILILAKEQGKLTLRPDRSADRCQSQYDQKTCRPISSKRASYLSTELAEAHGIALGFSLTVLA